MNKTFTPSSKDIKQNWHLIDANDQVLGKVASRVTSLLMGKHSPIFTPNINTGDKVVVINAEKVVLTGNRGADKIYHRITGFPGGVKSETFEKLIVRRPTEVIKKAVYGMLPKNKLRKDRMNNLYIYQGPTHPHEGQIAKQNA